MRDALQDQELKVLRFQAQSAIERARAVVTVSREIRKRLKIEKAVSSEPFNVLVRAIREERMAGPKEVALGFPMAVNESSEDASVSSSSR